MIELRAAESNDELELWRSVRIAVLPNERTASVAELRSRGSFMLLAYRDRSEVARVRGTLRVRRDRPAGGAGPPGRPDEQRPAVPDGIDVVTLAERRELLPRLYHELALQAFEDIPTPRKVEITLEQWETEWVNWPEATFVALAGDEIVVMAGLNHDADRPDRAENALTTVRRDQRGQGLARMLKETATAWASAHGIREIYTWTQTGNENMRAVNERLGYVTRDVSISVRRKLPL